MQTATYKIPRKDRRQAKEREKYMRNRVKLHLKEFNNKSKANQ